MNTKITELLGIKYPVLQGGMAWIAESGLAAAVSNAGGAGIIAGGSAPAEVIREEIRKAKALTDKPLRRKYYAYGSQRRGFGAACNRRKNPFHYNRRGKSRKIYGQVA